MDALNLVILVGASLVLVSILTSLISFRVGAPLLLVFLGVGLGAGEDGLGIIFDDARIAFLIGTVALTVILFDSGFNTPLSSFRLAAWPAIVLATVGVILTAGIVGVIAHYVLGIGWLEALLAGAILGSTDAAAVFFLLRVGGITIRERVRSTLEVESGSNDPIAIFLTIGLVELIAAEGSGPLDFAIMLVMQAVIGSLAGVIGGRLLTTLLNRLPLEAGLHPVLAVASALALYAATATLGGSGFLAAYIAGLIAGNARLRTIQALRRFQLGLTWLAQIVMFVMLGLLATPSQFPSVLVSSLVVAVVLILVARPIAVWLCLAPFRLPRNEIAFIAWVGLRGAVSILLAIVPALYGIDGGQSYFNFAFLVVVVSLVVQGWTIRPLARWLGLIVPPRIGPVDRTELDLPGSGETELVAYRIHPQSPVVRGQRLPRWARPSLIVRDGRQYTIHNVRQLLPGDIVYLFASPSVIPLYDRLFAGTREIGEDDTQFYGDFALDPATTVQAVAEMYGLPLNLELADLSVSELIERELGGAIGVGDRLRFGSIELIVRELGEDGKIASVGLALEPTPASTRRIPLFQTPGEIGAGLARLGRRSAAMLRRLRRRLRRQPAAKGRT